MKKLIGILAVVFGSGFCAVQAAEISAVLEWSQRVELTTPVSGKVLEVKVNEGSLVRQGDALLALDSRAFRAHIRQAEGELVRAREKQSEARRELERGKELFERTVISIHDLQLIKIDFASAEAKLREAEAKLSLARLDLEYSTLRAPFNGRVILRNVEPGQVVVTRLQTTPLLVLVAADRMLARAYIQEEAISRLKVGDAVKVRIGSKTQPARIAALGQEPDSTRKDSVQYRLDVEFTVDANELYRKGQSATILLP